MLPLLCGGVWSLFPSPSLRTSKLATGVGGLFQHGNPFTSRDTTFTERQSVLACSSDGQLIKHKQRNVHIVFRKLVASGRCL